MHYSASREIPYSLPRLLHKLHPDHLRNILCIHLGQLFTKTQSCFCVFDKAAGATVIKREPPPPLCLRSSSASFIDWWPVSHFHVARQMVSTPWPVSMAWREFCWTRTACATDRLTLKEIRAAHGVKPSALWFLFYFAHGACHSACLPLPSLRLSRPPF